MVTVFCGFQRCVWGIPDRLQNVSFWGSFSDIRRHEKRVAIYARMLDSDEQTTENQIRELQAVADRHGWTVVSVSMIGCQRWHSARGRPAMRALLRAVARREVDMVAAWAVDRLGRSLIDCWVSSRNCMRRRSTSICTSKGWTPPRQPDGRCSRCSACSRNSSGR